MLLISAGQIRPQDNVPAWVVHSCYVTIGLGTSRRMAHRQDVGQRITTFARGRLLRELSGSITLFFGDIPRHTGVHHAHDQPAPSSGVGATQSFISGALGPRSNIVWAWVLTIPCSAFMAASACGSPGWFCNQIPRQYVPYQKGRLNDPGRESKTR